MKKNNTITMIRYTFFILLLTLSFPSFGQDNAETIFKKASEKLFLTNMEMTINIKETGKNKQVKEKTFHVLMAKFGMVEKTKTVIQKPIRAEGVTIVITKNPKKSGLIEIFTPANGKIRKLKATPQNMDRVGASSPISNYTSMDTNELYVKLIGKQQLDDKPNYLIMVTEKKDTTGSKAEFLIDEKSFRILQIVSYDSSGNKSISNLSDFQDISGYKGKVYPMHIVTKSMKDGEEKDIKVLSLTPRPDVKEEDFKILSAKN
ncbi:MAG: hypothetical protein CO119_10390 [Flavobacteriales bacterium CG_4_9_14_3_um_filter_40_17]|nr:MAG: hypothetical protein CO119_10390 [Flavobacteriales bacterium CG_4_9_14_3_um_filter_40_17]